MWNNILYCQMKIVYLCSLRYYKIYREAMTCLSLTADSVDYLRANVRLVYIVYRLIYQIIPSASLTCQLALCTKIFMVRRRQMIKYDLSCHFKVSLGNRVLIEVHRLFSVDSISLANLRNQILCLFKMYLQNNILWNKRIYIYVKNTPNMYMHIISVFLWYSFCIISNQFNAEQFICSQFGLFDAMLSNLFITHLFHLIWLVRQQ